MNIWPIWEQFKVEITGDAIRNKSTNVTSVSPWIKQKKVLYFTMLAAAEKRIRDRIKWLQLKHTQRWVGPFNEPNEEKRVFDSVLFVRPAVKLWHYKLKLECHKESQSHHGAGIHQNLLLSSFV